MYNLESGNAIFKCHLKYFSLPSYFSLNETETIKSINHKKLIFFLDLFNGSFDLAESENVRSLMRHSMHSVYNRINYKMYPIHFVCARHSLISPSRGGSIHLEACWRWHRQTKVRSKNNNVYNKTNDYSRPTSPPPHPHLGKCAAAIYQNTSNLIAVRINVCIYRFITCKA